MKCPGFDGSVTSRRILRLSLLAGIGRLRASKCSGINNFKDRFVFAVNLGGFTAINHTGV